MKIFTLTCVIAALLVGFSPQLYGQVTAEGDTVTCFGASDGTLIITATSGQAPFTYFWQRSTGNPGGGGPNSVVPSSICIQYEQTIQTYSSYF